MIKNLALGTALLSTLALLGCPSEDKAASKPSQPQAPKVETKTTTVSGGADEGKRVYMSACVTCHGPDGSGAMMRQMLPKIGDLTSPELHARMKDEEIASLITTGRDKMPPFGAVLKPDQIQAVVAYVRTLKKG